MLTLPPVMDHGSLPKRSGKLTVGTNPYLNLNIAIINDAPIDFLTATIVIHLNVSSGGFA